MSFLMDKPELKDWIASQGLQWPDCPFDIVDRLVLLAWRGSSAHGTYIPPEDPNSIDDKDLVGVIIPPPRFSLGLSQWDHTASIKGVWDIELHSYQKYVRLLCKQNPNVLSTIWQNPDWAWIYCTDAGRALYEERMRFQNRKVAFDAFCGYAQGQLKKMVQFEKQGYMGQKRAQLVSKFGFDTKNASHMIRLLRMGGEYLRDLKITVDRTGIDADELKEIKTGKWPLARVREEGRRLEDECRKAFDQSTMAEEIDREAIDRLLVDVQLAAWYR